MDVARSAPQGLTTMRILFTYSLNWNKEGGKAVPDQHSLYADGQHTLAFYIKCVPPVELLQ